MGPDTLPTRRFRGALPCAARWLGWGVLLATGCVQSQPVAVAPPTVAPLSAAVLPGAEPSPGEPLALVAGGLLAAPLVMPMWLDLREDARLDRKVHVFTEVAALALDERRLYLEQSNEGCGSCPANRACRVLDLTTAGLSEPAGCIEVQTGLHRRIAPLGGGWFAVYSDAEGVGFFSLVAWSPERGSHPLLEVETGRGGLVEAARESETSVVLRASCALPDGCARAVAGQSIEIRTYRFSEALGLREVR